MPREKKQAEPEQQAGAPEWMVTFSDCMTLLLTFFVLLLSFSSFSDQDNFRKMSSTFAGQVSFNRPDASETESLVPPRSRNDDIRWGIEKPTLDKGKKDWFKKQTPPADFLRLNTFLIASDEVFWGKGSVISRNGQRVLTDLALFVKELPEYMIIISESGPEDAYDTGGLGSNRTWSVFQYLTTQHGIGKEQLSISADGTAVKEYHTNNILQHNGLANERMLEIVLLKRDT